MNLAFYRMLVKANADQPKKPCGKCQQCSCNKSTQSHPDSK